MYGLILLFWTAQGVTPSAHIIPYATTETCAAAGKTFAQYESGVEHARAEAAHIAEPIVYWYCVPMQAAPGTPIT